MIGAHSKRSEAGAGRVAGAIDVATFDAVASAVRDGLGRRPRSLPPWLLYDERGSALFEEITRLPEYYLTRAERAILAERAPAIVEAAGPPLEVIELGAGSAEKTALLLEAVVARQGRATYVPVDVSPDALRAAAARLRGVHGLSVRPVVARYPEELGFLRGRDGVRRLVLFLGSNIGNYDPAAARALLAAVRRELAPGDAMLIGSDVRKARRLLVPAYDDARGVTARFAKNVLVRINRELDADFDVEAFRHVAEWNPDASRMELYLESLARQRVTIPPLSLDLAFAAGERIHTESSYKPTIRALRALLTSAGLRPEAFWRDPSRLFALHLARVGERGRSGRDPKVAFALDPADELRSSPRR
jgi:dimethylhistidine N-methyltransferase